VEGGVEAGHLRDSGQQPPYQPHRAQAGGLVQRGERDQGPELGQQGVVDDRRAGATAAVHDPVPDGVGLRPQLGNRVLGRLVGRLVERVLDVPGRDDLLTVEQAQLHTAGAGVDDQHPQPGHVQPEISGSSSPCTRV
jgi:hypothetical protein